MALHYAVVALLVSLAAGTTRGAGRDALLQTWGKMLNGGGASTGDTPVTRVVKLLKQMGSQLQKEMNEDADLYDKLACWCNTNEYDKTNEISAAEAKLSELGSMIESLAAKSAELKVTIKQLEDGVAANKQSLAEGLALREKEIQEFHGQETDAMQAVENLKAAILVLSKHHGSALPQLSFSLIQGMGRSGRLMPWEEDRETRLANSFNDFLEKNGFADSPSEPAEAAPKQKFLQQTEDASVAQGAPVSSATMATTGGSVWSDADTAILQRAMHSAAVFAQAHHSSDYYPSYAARSGEIMGVLRQLKEQMEGELSESQKAEMARAGAFAELRASKEAEIAAGEQQAEEKEDQLAKTDMDLAEAKEDLEQTTAALSEHQRFLLNLKKTCESGSKGFEERKSARLAEIKAVSECIAILTSDSARDTFSTTYAALVQVSASSSRRVVNRRRAAAVLRDVAAKVKSPELAVLATSVELDAFTRVKKAIDGMVAMLKQQQEDEVKKHDWCGSELHSNEVATTQSENVKADLDAKISDIDASIQRLVDEVSQAKASITELQVSLQRATENRKRENLEFQDTVADQVATQEVLKTALDKLATFYDKESLTQTARVAKGQRQAPPVPQAEYKPHSGSEGVMQLLEKLIHEAKGLQQESVQGEAASQAQYEALIANTNASVNALSKEVVSKTENLAEAKRLRTETQGDLNDTTVDLDKLAKYNSDLHAECDFLTSNFSTRQQARQEEIEALLQAKQILSGADLS